MTHVTFAFRYAHEFYADDLGGPDVDRGLEFPGERQPDYLDFLYFALVLGMTFQVSDVQITSRKLRRVATLHGLLSFLFNTVIVAFTVNIAAGHDGMTGGVCRKKPLAARVAGTTSCLIAEEQPDG